MSLDDPKARRSEGDIELDIEPGMVDRAYYRHIRAWLEDPGAVETAIVNRRIYYIRREPILQVGIGLTAEHLEMTRESDVMPEKHPRSQMEDRYIGRDGVLVELGPRWESRQMREEPQDR